MIRGFREGRRFFEELGFELVFIDRLLWLELVKGKEYINKVG